MTTKGVIQQDCWVQNKYNCFPEENTELCSIAHLEGFVSEVQTDYIIRVVEENRNIKMVKTAACTVKRRKIETQRLKHISKLLNCILVGQICWFSLRSWDKTMWLRKKVSLETSHITSDLIHSFFMAELTVE